MLLVLGVLPFVVLVVSHWSALPAAQSGDYAQYLLHAKAIAEGRPYGDIGYLFTPYNPFIGPRSQLPGWPALLAPGVAIFGTSLTFPKLLVVLAAVGMLVVAALRLGTHDDFGIAIATTAIVGVALESTYATNTALSDLPFACALWTLFWIADRPGPWTWKRALAVGALGSFAMATRVLGIAIVPGLAVLAFMRPREDRPKILAPVAAWALAGFGAILALGLRIPFVTQTFRSPEVVINRLRFFWPRTRFSVMEAMMYPFPWDLANDAYHALGFALALVGIVSAWRYLRRSAVISVAPVYLAVVAFAPVFDIRYLWPLWPVIVYVMLCGARTVVSWLRIAAVTRARIVSAGVVALTAIAVVVALQKPAPPALLDQPGVRELFGWLRSVDGSDSMRVVFVAPRVLTLETGVPAMGAFTTSSERTFREFERVRITHVIVGDAGTNRNEARELRSLVAEHSAAFSLVYRNEGFAVYELRSLVYRPAAVPAS